MDQASSKSNDWLDGIAVALSGLCVLHCLALPFLIGALPLLMPLAEGHLHLQLLAIVFPLSVVAIGLGYRRHRDPRVVAGAAIGLLLLFIGATVAHDRLGLLADRLFSIAGAIVLAIAHFYNSLLARRRRTARVSG